jgi:hypothetical protein
MKETKVTFPELGLIAGTRGILGAGIGFLLADRLSRRQRKAVGWSMLAIGAISTVPLAFLVFGRKNCRRQLASDVAGENEHSSDPQCVGAGL